MSGWSVLVLVGAGAVGAKAEPITAKERARLQAEATKRNQEMFAS